MFCATTYNQPFLIAYFVTVTILKPIKGEECLLCEAVIGYVNSALKDPNNEKSVEQLLDIACDKLPSFSKDMVSFIKTYLEMHFVLY